MLLVILTILGAIVSTLVALIALLNNPSSKLHRWLFLFIITACFWILASNLHNLFAPEIALWLLRLSFISVGIASFCMLQFVHAITEKTPKLRERVGEIFILFLILALSFSPFVIKGLAEYSLGGVVVPERSVGYPVAIVLILILIIKAFVLIAHRRRTARGRTRVQLSIILTGLVAGTVFGITTNVVLPNLLMNTIPSRFAFIAVLIWTLVLVYAVVQHRFLDIRLAVVRALAYILALGAVSLLYGVLIVLVSQFFLGKSRPTVFASYEILLVIFVALTFHPLKVFFDRITRRLFYRNAYDTQKVLDEVNNVFTQTVDLPTITSQSLEILSNALRPQFSVLFITRPGGNTVEHIQTINKNKKEAKQLFALTEDKLPQLTLIDDASVEAPRLAKHMNQHNLALIIRIETSNEQLGYIFFGFKENGSIYTNQDINLIRLVTDGLSISVQNALRFNEIQEFNATLQRRIDEATEELRRSNAQLQRLDVAKDEFVSMASHQLRTPLTSVKGYISMVLEGDAGKLSAMQKQLLDEAYTSSERMVHLINDFLNVSRLQTGKFTIERRQTDLAKVVQREVESLQTTATAHNMKLEYRKPSRFPVLYVDEAKLSQVIMNFVDNAIYYSPERSTIKLKLEVTGGEAILTVKDNGIGVPKAEQQHLFTKFFRATNARKQRPDGTGVGLFLAKKVVVAHGGSIVFESSEDEGSTFGFRLPIKKLSAAPKQPNKLNK